MTPVLWEMEEDIKAMEALITKRDERIAQLEGVLDVLVEWHDARCPVDYDEDGFVEVRTHAFEEARALLDAQNGTDAVPLDAEEVT